MKQYFGEWISPAESASSSTEASAAAPVYRHVQFGYLLLLLNAALGLLFAIQMARGGSRLLLLPLIVVLAVGALFGTLTVEVTADQLRFRFGPGGWGKAVRLADIVSVAPTRSSLLEGVGIRATRQGMLYNVAPGQAVEITLLSGHSFRLGTDQPEQLARIVAETWNEQADVSPLKGGAS